MKKLIYLFLITLTVLPGCGNDTPRADNVLARFKGGVLTMEDLEAHHRSLKRQSKYRNNPEMLTPEFVFNHALNMEMIIAMGLRKKLHHDAYIRQDLHSHMSNLFLKVMRDELMPEIDKESISEEEMRTFYEAHRENYRKNELYSLLAFEVDPDLAAEVMQKLTADELGFNKAALQYAKNEEKRRNGGHIGKRSLRRFQPEWRPVVASLAIGRITGPLEINGKTYIMLLENKTEPYQYTFEEKQAYIRNDVLYNRYRDEWQKVYDRLQREFKVKINQAELKAFYKRLSAENKEKQK